ncbi:hypothetical protein TIFTF001_000538 [Ficus carica]|uniref:HMA domain-containing protein n=1 Tax=Ficus carica TaxID=3494 RepID=A0AA87YVB5_FICCA|nr:hypothetical protein TIFTF001_000538 [Ficus carica]
MGPTYTPFSSLHLYLIPATLKPDWLPVSPRPYSYEKRRKSCSDNNSKQISEVRRKSSADIYDLKSSRRSTSPPAGSSRYLLSDAPLIDWLSEENHDIDHVQRRRVVTSVDDHHQRPAAKVVKFRSLSTKESSSSSLTPSSSSCTSTRSRHQVVVLMVSLHCKGCEGKLRKHLSKMEVTVIGDITPLGVLASVSKVKYAQLWPSHTSSSPSSSWTA